MKKIEIDDDIYFEWARHAADQGISPDALARVLMTELVFAKVTMSNVLEWLRNRPDERDPKQSQREISIEQRRQRLQALADMARPFGDEPFSRDAAYN